MSRRNFLKLAGRALAAAPAMPAVVSQAVGREFGSAIGLMGGYSAAAAPAAGKWTHRLLSKLEYHLLTRSRSDFLATHELSALHRQDGCDPEIACLRSLSPSARKRMQLRRDQQTKAQISRMDDRLWPFHDDDE